MHRTLKVAIIVSVLSLLVVLVAGCSSAVEANSPTMNDRVIEVDLNSFIVDADQTTISAGEVTFATTNSDFVVHELLVVPVADLSG
jgi:ABC-type Fe3+-citrate transport system substrate-binding protein